jgi:LuxR family transcriptional regulator, maltose regulon positive regulatory protein
MSTSQSPEIAIRLFEPLEIAVDGQIAIDANYARHKAKALFAYLYLHHGRRISKYQLLAELWPTAENAEPGRVKHTVQVLRSAIEPGHRRRDWRFILEQGGAYCFNAEASRDVDAETFERELELGRLARRDGEREQALNHFRAAIDLRRGPLLAEFRYDDWAAPEIARLQDLYLQLLIETARLEASQSDYRPAIDHLRLAIREDPLHERSYLELMRFLCLDGRRTEALRVYLGLREVLNKTLGVEPQSVTTRLYEAMRRDEHAVAD